MASQHQSLPPDGSSSYPPQSSSPVGEQEPVNTQRTTPNSSPLDLEDRPCEAAARVFGTPELLEMILISLVDCFVQGDRPAKFRCDVLNNRSFTESGGLVRAYNKIGNVRTVCKFWQAAVKGSPALRRKFCCPSDVARGENPPHTSAISPFLGAARLAGPPQSRRHRGCDVTEISLDCSDVLRYFWYNKRRTDRPETSWRHDPLVNSQRGGALAFMFSNRYPTVSIHGVFERFYDPTTGGDADDIDDRPPDVHPELDVSLSSLQHTRDWRQYYHPIKYIALPPGQPWTFHLVMLLAHCAIEKAPQQSFSSITLLMGLQQLPEGIEVVQVQGIGPVASDMRTPASPIVHEPTEEG